MAPKKGRKKSTTKPLPVDAQQGKPLESSAVEPSTPNDATQAELPQSPPPQTWLGGTWPRNSKAAPVTQIARESISSASDAVANGATSIKSSKQSLQKTRSPSLSLTKSAGSANRASLADTSISKIHATSTESRQGASQDDGLDVPASPTSNKRPLLEENEDEVPNDMPDGDGQKPAGETTKDGKDRPMRQKDGLRWFGWFSKDSKTATADAAKIAHTGEDTEASKKSEPEGTDASKALDIPTSTSQEPEPKESTPRIALINAPKTTDPAKISQQVRSVSWLPMWATPSQSSTNVDQQGKTDTLPPSVEATGTEASASATSTMAPSTSAKADLPKAESQPAKKEETSPRPPNVSRSSGWVFWSRDRGREKDLKSGETAPAQVGELAVSDTPSQMHPESAVVDEAKGMPNASKARKDTLSIPAKGKEDKSACPVTPQRPIPNASAQDKTKDASAKDIVDASKQLQKQVQTIVLPSLRNTFQHQEGPSFLQQVAQFLGYFKSPEIRHVSIVKNPAPIKRALAIGVHGFFPATLIRSVIGQPTGTSIKFSNMAAKAIRKWAEAKGIPCKVEKVALEGEGKIAERVELLWKLLLNWIDDIRKADFIMIACHSQGVPVAVMLVAKLILFGCSPSRIGLCCMAGVNQGPFADYKSRFISGSAGELFDFSNPNSKVSQEYAASLEVCLKFGVKIVYAGSIDDQLVSIESATFTTVTHPHIYRAVFVDGRVHAPSFLSHLVGFTLKLRNLGIPDHGLIRELSTPLAGSIYTGAGHSTIYEDETVYDLAVEYALETTSVGEVTPRIQDSRGVVTPNPYILPFAMRGLLEEDYVRTELQEEISELLKQFDDWRPSTKALKDVKFRLEGIRSKL